MKRMFVRSGGGIPGLLLYGGIEQAMFDYGIAPSTENDINSGTSAGSIRGGFDSTGASIEDYNDLMYSLQDKDLRKSRFLWKLRIPFISSWLSKKPIKKILKANMPDSFEDLMVPLYVHATDFEKYSHKEFSSGPLIPAILASMSIAGIFSGQTIDGVQYVDGGVVRNLPLRSNWRDFDVVYLLAGSNTPQVDDGNMISRLLYNLETLMEDQINDVLKEVGIDPAEIYRSGGAYVKHGKTLVVAIRPVLDVKTSMLHVDHSLIGKAYDFTTKVLDSGLGKVIMEHNGAKNEKPHQVKVPSL